MDMKSEDVILCYLFMKAAGNETNETDGKQKPLEYIYAKLSDWEKEKFDEFCNQNQQQDARALLKSTCDEYCSSNEWLIDDDENRFRAVLWTLIDISYSGGTRSVSDIAFIKEFASRMKIDSSYVQEFEDIARTAVILEEQRSWIDEARLPYSEGKVISEQISQDEDILLKSTDAIVRLG